jgi:hypothetical protein
VRASKKLRTDELYLTRFNSTRLKMELDRVPLWRGDQQAHVSVKQLVEDFARYLYLPRMKDSAVLLNAISDGVNLLTWAQDSFGFADSFDEAAGRYKGLRGGTAVMLTDALAPELLVEPDVARRQLDEEGKKPKPDDLGEDGGTGGTGGGGEEGGKGDGGDLGAPQTTMPKRFHGTVNLDSTRTGRDAGQVADEVIAHLVGLVGAEVTVTLEIDARLPGGAPDNVVRTVTENSRTLKFTNQGFEED